MSRSPGLEKSCQNLEAKSVIRFSQIILFSRCSYCQSLFLFSVPGLRPPFISVSLSLPGCFVFGLRLKRAVSTTLKRLIVKLLSVRNAGYIAMDIMESAEVWIVGVFRRTTGVV